MTPAVEAIWDTAIRRENLLTDECVKRKTGMRIPYQSGRLPPYWENGDSVEWQRLTVAHAKRRGFGVWATYVKHPESHFDRWLASLSSARRRQLNKAMIETDKNVVVVSTFDGNTASVGSGGCLAEARAHMKDHGYRTKSLDTVVSKLVIPLYKDGRVTMAAKAREKRIAVATARCEAATGIIAAHLEAERIVIDRFSRTDLAFFRHAIAASYAAAR